MNPQKNPAAVALGRLGGQKRKLSPEDAREMQRKSAEKRRANKTAAQIRAMRTTVETNFAPLRDRLTNTPTNED
jgi:hypothetical protein